MSDPRISPPTRTASEVVIWTALPQGTLPSSSSTLRLTAYVTPQLAFLEYDGVREITSTTLSSFHDWVNWPQTAGDISLKIKFTAPGPGGASTLVVPTVDRSGLNSDYWTAIFNPDITRVDTYAADDLSKQTIKSYESSAIHKYMTGLYGGFNPGTLSLDSSGKPTDSSDPTATSYATMLKGPPIIASALSFHNAYYEPGLQPPSEPPAAPILDFHEAVSSLGAYPELLIAFGLAIPMQVDLPSEFASTDTFTIEVIPSWTSNLQNTINVVLQTQCTMDSVPAFLPAPFGSDYGSGFLILQNSQFSIVDVDIDGGSEALNTYNEALSNLIESYETASDFSVDVSLPNLRSAGPSILWSDWGGAAGGGADSSLNLSDLAARQSTIISSVESWVNAKRAGTTLPSLPVIYAEDVNRGWRIDILDESKTYGVQSLHWRQASYQFGPGGAITVDGSTQAPVESYVTPAVTQQAVPGQASNTVAVHESIARWDGWSLATPKPGGQINDDGTASAHAGNPMPDPANTDAAGNINPQISAEFTSPPAGMTVTDPVTGLPTLRFGGMYGYRARSVDLSGWSVPQATEGDTPTILYATHYRWEPIQTPIVIPTGELQPGESALTIVISDTGSGPSTSSRWLFPPKVHELMAEEMGALDTADGLPDPTLYSTIVGFNDRTPGGLPGATTVSAVGSGPYLTVPAVSGAPLTSIWLPDPYSDGVAITVDSSVFTLGAFGDPNAPFGPDSFVDPWVPTGSSDVAWPALPGKLLQVVAYTATPNSPLTLPPLGSATDLTDAVVPAFTVTPATDTTPETITIAITPASVATFELSSATGEFGLIGVYDWALHIPHPGSGAGLDRHPAAQPDLEGTGQNIAASGELITPSRLLTLVYAVQQPLIAPQFSTPIGVFGRPALNDTSAAISDSEFVYDGPSTDKITFTATWTDPLDSPADPDNDPTTDTVTSSQGSLVATVTDIYPPATVPDPTVPVSASNATPFGQIGLGPSGQYPTMTLEATQRIGDTKHHLITYTPTGTSRFGQYFVQTQSLQLSTRTPTVLDASGIDPSLVTVRLPATDVANAVTVPPTDYTVDGRAGTIILKLFEHIHLGKLPTYTAATVAQGNPPTDVLLSDATLLVTFAPSTTLTGEASSFHVLNSGIVPALNIAKVVPAWGTETLTLQNNETVYNRSGNIIRIYLERPWYATGANEYLGVITADTVFESTTVTAGLPTSVAADQVTLLGFDPITISGHNSGAAGTYTQTQLSFVPNVQVPNVSDLAGPGINPLPGINAIDTEYSTEIWCYQPAFDAAANQWFVDVELDVSTLPEPLPPGYFLRLALVRVQPFSNDGDLTYASAISLVTFAQPVPNRSVGVWTSGTDAVTVTVTGPGYQGWRPAPSGGGTQVDDVDNLYAEHPHSDGKGSMHTSTMIVEVQGYDDSGVFTGDFGWSTVEGHTYELTPDFSQSPMIEWSSAIGGIALPTGFSQLRLRVSELDFRPEGDIPPINTSLRRPFVAFIDL